MGISDHEMKKKNIQSGPHNDQHMPEVEPSAFSTVTPDKVMDGNPTGGGGFRERISKLPPMMRRNAVLSMQRSYGNSAVQRILEPRSTSSLQRQDGGTMQQIDEDARQHREADADQYDPPSEFDYSGSHGVVVQPKTTTIQGMRAISQAVQQAAANGQLTFPDMSPDFADSEASMDWASNWGTQILGYYQGGVKRGGAFGLPNPAMQISVDHAQEDIGKIEALRARITGASSKVQGMNSMITSSNASWAKLETFAKDVFGIQTTEMPQQDQYSALPPGRRMETDLVNDMARDLNIVLRQARSSSVLGGSNFQQAVEGYQRARTNMANKAGLAAGAMATDVARLKQIKKELEEAGKDLQQINDTITMVDTSSKAITSTLTEINRIDGLVTSWQAKIDVGKPTLNDAGTQVIISDPQIDAIDIGEQVRNELVSKAGDPATWAGAVVKAAYQGQISKLEDQISSLTSQRGIIEGVFSAQQSAAKVNEYKLAIQQMADAQAIMVREAENMRREALQFAAHIDDQLRQQGKLGHNEELAPQLMMLLTLVRESKGFNTAASRQAGEVRASFADLRNSIPPNTHFDRLSDNTTMREEKARYAVAASQMLEVVEFLNARNDHIDEMLPGLEAGLGPWGSTDSRGGH